MRRILTIEKKVGRDTIWFNPEFMESAEPQIFDLAQHRRGGSLTGSATGRVTARANCALTGN